VIKAFALCFSILLVASGMQGFIAFSFFKLNQPTIELTVCVNKSKPLKKCHGKCYLKKKLLEQKNNQNNSTHFTELTNALTLFPPTAIIHSQIITLPNCKINSFYLYPKARLHHPAIDYPPKFLV
jgi:hypothetical protein